MVMAPLSILYEDNHLLVINKPPMLPTMGVAEGHDSLLHRAKQYIKQKYDKPGNVYLGVVSRLDAPVTGAVVLARTSKAAKRLGEQFRLGTVEKIYWAVVSGQVEPAESSCTDWVLKDERARKMVVASRAAPGAKEARLSYRTVAQVTGGTLLEIKLETGRKHQIRLQLADRGYPVLGDSKYGSQTSFAAGIALHARRLSFLHPVRKTPISLVAPLPKAWRKLG
jgi:23S rRNA pseudouridine1911/1915/1917 synthase